MVEDAGNEQCAWQATASSSPSKHDSLSRQTDLVIPISAHVDHPAWNFERIRRAVQEICTDAGISSGEISVAIVGKGEMQDLHRRFLGDDSPTDVMAFPLAAAGSHMAGEIVVCWDVALETAAEFQWRGEDELLLYVIHGALHLVGYDDTSDQAFQRMRIAEQKYLEMFGLTLIGRDCSAHPEERRP